MKRLGFAFVLLAGLLVLFFGANGSGSAPPAYAQTADACGTEDIDVPDSGESFDFTEACAAHDACYAAGGGPFARARCDRAFYNDMLAWCNAAWQQDDPRLGHCKVVATTYYAAVRLTGWLFFYS